MRTNEQLPKLRESRIRLLQKSLKNERTAAPTAEAFESTTDALEETTSSLAERSVNEESKVSKLSTSAEERDQPAEPSSVTTQKRHLTDDEHRENAKKNVARAITTLRRNLSILNVVQRFEAVLSEIEEVIS